MEKLNRKNHPFAVHPEKILQVGGGNFLKGFIGWMIDILNERNGLDAGIVVARPTDSRAPLRLHEQDHLYTTLLRGYDERGTLRNEKRIVSAVTREISIYRDYAAFLEVARNPHVRFVVSNTTEAGIAYDGNDRFDDSPPSSFPAKMTCFLHERFVSSGGASDSGFVFLPCELIDHNGEELRRIILQYVDLWNLGKEFRTWVVRANTFCSTLVDRIVTGYPENEAPELARELRYADRLMVAGEFFHLFVIQGPESLRKELRLDGSGLNIHLVEDLKPYKERKVGILNGCHTALVPVALLSGVEFVDEAVSDSDLAAYLEQLLEREIIPSLDMPADALREYAASVISRFRNPFIKHRLSDIALNSMAKFKARLLPQLLTYHEANGCPPPLMSLSLAALICFYSGDCDGKAHSLKDEQVFLDLYQELWSKAGNAPLTPETAMEIAGGVLSLESHWGVDLTSLDGLPEKVAADMVDIRNGGMMATLKGYL